MINTVLSIQERALIFRVLISALAILAFAPFANAGTVFMDCEDIPSINSYKPLQKYISTKDEGNELCQQIEENEYLYTTHDNIYYCKSALGKALKCEENEKGQALPELSVIKRFSADKGQQFVLFRTRNISQEVFNDVYFIFFLVPKKVNPRGYQLFTLPSAGAGDRNEGSGRCVNAKDADVITTQKLPVEILNESQSNVAIRFNQFRTNCSNNGISKQTLEFTWQNGNFKQTKNLIEVMKETH